MTVLAVLEHSANATWNRVSFESLEASRRIAAALQIPLAATVLGNNYLPVQAAEAAAYPLSGVYLLRHPLLADYTSEAFTDALEGAIRHIAPAVVVFPHTYQVRDYAPALAARFGSTLISDVVSFETGPTLADFCFTRQLFLGKLLADVRSAAEPTFVSIQAGAFPPILPIAANATMETVNVQISPDRIVSRPEPPVSSIPNAVDLRSADRIVSVGRGFSQSDNLAAASELAQLLGAELAASRPVCDAGCLPMDRLVGSSGQTVSPQIYFALGISGAIQHLLGMKGSRTIVAINKDESAPIFEVAQYGIVGDLRSVVPALLNELRKAKP